MGARLEYTARRREGEPSTVKPNRRNSRLSQRKRNNLGIARDEDEGSYLEKVLQHFASHQLFFFGQENDATCAWLMEREVA
eukprot:828296-Pleurochrysis_carterae.AAC.8